MSNDRELLEVAAKAAGIEIMFWSGRDVCAESPVVQPDGIEWNPLRDDGDALRLGVKLNMGISVDFDRVDVSAPGGILATEFRYDLPSPTDPCAATRRAIVRAAAEIGKSMS